MSRQKLLLVGALVVLIAAFFYFDLAHFLSLDYIKRRQADVGVARKS